MPRKNINKVDVVEEKPQGETISEIPEEKIVKDTEINATPKIEPEEVYASSNRLLNLLGSNLVRNNKQLGVVSRFSRIALNTFFVLLGGSITAIAVLVYCFLQYPRPTANFFAYRPVAPPEKVAVGSGPAVLAATTAAPNMGQTVASTVLYPHAVVALAIVRQVDPQLYTEVAPTVIPPSVTDVFQIGTQNQLTPQGQLVIQKNGAGMNLKVLSQDLVNNLNADLVQGRRPGTAIGDLAIFGLGGAIDGLSVGAGNIITGAVTADAIAPQAVTTTGIANKTILSANIADGTVTGGNIAGNTITSSNITDATITDSDIATGAAIGNSKLAQLTSSNLVAGSAVELSATGGLTNSAGLSLLRTCSVSQTLIWDGSAWVCGSSSGGSLALAEDGTTIVSSATTLNVTGSDFTLTNPSANTGLLAVDYANSGITRKAQNETVSGIWTFSNGLTVSGGSVTLPAASISNTALANSSLTISPGTGLSGGGTISLGGSATVNLANTSVAAGTYGSSGSTVPIFTVDAQGRISSASSYVISGLTTSNFGSGNISQWTNNSGYITAGSSDVLSNKTISAGSNTISGLTVTNFGSANISQWFNDIGFITATGSAVLSNKTINATANTISNITNANLSGSAGITNANLANSAITINTTGPLGGGGTVALGGALTLTCTTCSATSGALFTAAASSGSSYDVTPSATLTFAAGTNMTTTGNGAGTITFATSATPVFTTVNGLTITNNGTNTLSIAAGKTLTANSSLTFTGTDGTTFTFPTISDDVVGRTAGQVLTNKTIAAGSNTISGLSNINFASTNISQWFNDVGFITATSSSVLSGKTINALSNTISGLSNINFGLTNISQWFNDVGFITATSSSILSNKTIAAGSNTISGLTNSNLSGSAGITNANLANSTFSFQGNSGSGAVSLGSTLFVTGTGLTTVTATSSGLTINSTGGSLQNAYDVGNTITTSTGRNIAFTLPAGLVTPTSLTLTNNGTADSFVITDAANTNIDGATRRSIFITPGAITQNTAGSTGMYSGVDVTLPALTLTSGNALTVNGMRITTDGLTQTAGLLTNNGLLVDSTGSTITTGGIINGVRINGPTTIPSVGTYNNLFLGTSTSSTANTLDQATIAVGSISATAQNNFATLNITNGGSGYLDVELLHGMLNMQGMSTLDDEFTDRVLNTTNRWTSTVTGAGTSCSIIAGGIGGLFRMTTGGGAGRGCELTTQAIGSLTSGFYQQANNPVFETRLRINTVANARIAAGFTDTRIPTGSDTVTSSNHAYILKRAADTTWQCAANDGTATETVTNTGVTIVANTFYRLRVEVRNGTTHETICTVDDGTTVTRTVVTATQPGATSPMDVYVRDNQSDAVIKWMDVDYVRAWQDDPVLAVDNASAQNVLSASITPTPTPDVSSSSASLANVIADGINNIFHNLVEFFNTVIFHADVMFLGHVTFGGDSAGVATVKAGESGAIVTFSAPYQNNPIVTANVNLVGGITPDQVPQFAVYDVTGKGFTIKLSRPAASDLQFSWVAIGNTGQNSVNAVSIPTPMMPAILPIMTVSPTVTPTSSSSAVFDASQSGTVSP